MLSEYERLLVDAVHECLPLQISAAMGEMESLEVALAVEKVVLEGPTVKAMLAEIKALKGNTAIQCTLCKGYFTGVHSCGYGLASMPDAGML